MSPLAKRMLALSAGIALAVSACRNGPPGLATSVDGASVGLAAEPPEAREYRGHTWAEYRATPGHSAHRGNDKIVCKDCHAAGYQEAPTVACGREGCHTKELAQPHGNDGEKGCLRCHLFEPGRIQPKCDECHNEPQLRGSTQLAAIKDGHAKAECAKCHKSHEAPRSVSAPCESCHHEAATAHAMHEGSKGCGDCHAPHSSGKAAKNSCKNCHKEPVGPHPAEHDTCVDCHDPHATGATTFEACIKCHGKKPTLRASTVEKHTECTSCHLPHSPKTAGDASCQKCHPRARVAHPAQAPELRTATSAPPPRACAACHVPHPKSGEQKVASCSSCHEKVGTTDRGVHAAKLFCTSCHRPHDFKAPTSVGTSGFCARCHTRESKLTAARKGHTDCTSCHTAAHTEPPPPPCSSCHANELATAPKGHAVCTDCHDPHSGSMGRKDPCARCHEGRSSGPHAAVKGGCANCHRPHGPNGSDAPPSCVSCHAKPSLLGLHASPGHADCARCHLSHQSPRTTRESCTDGPCHAAQRTHEPDAKRCNACHLFR